MWWSFVCLISLGYLGSASCKMVLHFLFGLMLGFSCYFCINLCVKAIMNAEKAISYKLLLYWELQSILGVYNW
jgi:hypothetical protein